MYLQALPYLPAVPIQIYLRGVPYLQAKHLQALPYLPAVQYTSTSVQCHNPKQCTSKHYHTSQQCNTNLPLCIAMPPSTSPHVLHAPGYIKYTRVSHDINDISNHLQTPSLEPIAVSASPCL
ncbi:hypothetical protein BaRGS_00021404 [Batillaria attramentaria]|uniref:Uncharacterized protein n=1 Tax=Batillaria attramentaria TaxID=370345 RepID=A0ABD0KKJ7_9CAEN